MLDGIAAAEILRGARGDRPWNRESLRLMIGNVSRWWRTFRNLRLDLNPVVRNPPRRHRGRTCAWCWISSRRGALPAEPGRHHPPDEPDHEAGAGRVIAPRRRTARSAIRSENLINGGYQGAIYPIHPSATRIMAKRPTDRQGCPRGHRRWRCSPFRPVRRPASSRVVEKKIPGAVLIPSGLPKRQLAGQRAGGPSPSSTTSA